jgi:hypothetical protein
MRHVIILTTAARPACHYLLARTGILAARHSRPEDRQPDGRWSGSRPDARGVRPRHDAALLDGPRHDLHVLPGGRRPTPGAPRLPRAPRWWPRDTRPGPGFIPRWRASSAPSPIRAPHGPASRGPSGPGRLRPGPRRPLLGPTGLRPAAGRGAGEPVRGASPARGPGSRPTSAASSRPTSSRTPATTRPSGRPATRRTGSASASSSSPRSTSGGTTGSGRPA